MRKLYLLGIFLLLSSFNISWGTAASYSFSAFSSTFTTIVGVSGTTSTTAISGDDQTLTSVGIGFNFVFNCTTYTTLSVCTNGWISLANSSDRGWVNGNTTVSTAFYPTPGSGFLMAYWDDLHGGGHTAYYSTTGTAPNRVFTFEWSNFHTYSASGNATFQIKLYETTNIIQYCYGSSSYSSTSATIGIANSTSDYLTLSDRSSSPTPSSSTFYTTTISTSPAANQVYQFSPSGNLVIDPSNTSPICAGSSFTLNGTVTSGTATGYAWSGPGGFTSTLQNPTVTGATTSMAGIYTFTATSSCGSVTDTTTVRVDTLPSATISGTTSFCSGGSSIITFTGTAGATVTYNINGGSALTVTLGASGTATVSTGVLTTGSTATTYTYSLVSITLGSCGQALSGTAVVTVNPNPFSSISGSRGVCVGGTDSLGNITTGGTWTSSNTSLATIGASSGVLYGISVGHDTVRYTLPTGCFVFDTFNVLPLPLPITGPSNVCMGASINLISTTTGSYLWRSSDTTIATVTNTGIVTGRSPGTVIVSILLGICSVSTSITVNPIPSPIIGLRSVCLGNSTALSDTTSGGSWSSSNAAIASVGASSGIVFGATTGLVNITYTIASGCYVTDTFRVNALPSAITGSRTVCEGYSTTLGNAATGGTWTSSNTSVAAVGSSSGTVFGVAAGLVTITYTLPTGCMITDTFRVNPQPTAITGLTAVCVGSAIALGCSPAGGTWSTSNGAVASVNTTGTVSGVSAATATISYMLPGGCYSTDVITVNPLPGTITGSGNVCLGLSTTLGNASTGGNWSSSNSAIATIDPSSGSVYGSSVGTVNITYTLPTGCLVTSTFTVNPLPSTITGPSAVCVGSTITVGSTPAAGTWSSSNTAVATIDAGGNITGVAGGSATITYTVGSSCYITTGITVNVLPATITGTLSVCAGGSTTSLSDATAGGVWISSNTAIATVDASGTVSGVSAGAVIITYMLSATTCQVTAGVTVNPLPTTFGGPSAVCIGANITVTNAIAGGSWTSGDVTIASISTTGIVTGVSAGSVLITYTTAAGCVATTTINVNGVPGVITGATVVCQGSVITLGNAVTGGTWSSSNTAIASVDATTGDVYGVSAGGVTISYSLGTGCYVTTGVTVNPLPALIAGATDVCYTYTTLYTDGTAGGTWSSSNTAVATISTGGLITGATVGTAIITYSLGTGCLRTANITVDALPTIITGANVVCAGSTTPLSDTISGGTWTTSNVAIASVNAGTGLVTGVAAGICTITYTIASGCFITMSMTVNPLPAAITGAANVCENSSVTLTDVTGTGTWSSSNAAIATIDPATGIVTGVTAGSVTIFYTLPSTCVIGRVLTVNVTPLAITGTTSVCEGGATTALSDPTGGGTWSTSNVAIASVAAGSGVVTGVTAGAVTITYTVGTCYNTTTVTVRPLPGATVTPLSDTIMCPGAFVILTATTGSGYTYQWYNGATVLSGETNSYYTAYSAGSYRIAITNTFGCTSVSAPMSVIIITVPATVTPAGATTFCAGGSVTLNANTGAGLTYQWLHGGTAIAGAIASSYTATTGGNYSVVVTNSTGCSATSSAITITVLAAPPGTITLYGPSNFCNGDSLVMVADTPASISYQWQLGGVNIAGATSMSYTTLSAGNYRVIESNGAGCTTTSAVVAATVLALPNATIAASGPTTFCVGGSVTLSVPPTAGNTYQWMNSGIAIPGATNSTYVASTSSSMKVRVTSAAGCVNITAAAVMIDEVTVPVVIPLTPTTYCWGGSALLGISISSSAGVTYQWQRGGINIPGATAGTYNANTGGSYSCIVSVASGACVIGAVAVTVTELPLPNPVIIWDGLHLKTGTFFTTYQWYKNLAPISGATSWSIIPTDTGRYTVQVTDTNGCHSTAPEYPLHHVNPSGITTLTRGDIYIYPNPAENNVHIVATEKVRAIINTVDGRKLIDETDATDIDISNLANGIYLLQLYDKDGIMLKIEKLTKN